MKVKLANIEDTYHVYCNIREYMNDIGEDSQLDPNVWFDCFSNPFFLCSIGFHGKRQTIGQAWGLKDPINKTFMLGGIFLRRKFRKKPKYLLSIVRQLRNKIKSDGIKKISFSANETTQKRAFKRKFKLEKFLMERTL